LRFHLQQDLAGDDITEVARLAEGATAAELMEIVRGARRKGRHEERQLTLDDLKSQIRGEQTEPPGLLRRIAVHEAAHAVTAVAIPIGRLRYVRLQSTGTTGGHTKIHYDDDDLTTLEDIENRVTSILSAGVAERLLLGSISTGSGGDDRSDLGVATSLLSVIHASTCLTGNLFHLCSTDDAPATVRADPRLRRAVEQHLRKLEIRATSLVEHHLESITAVAEALAKKRYLSGDEVVAIMQAVGYLKLIGNERS
jgi:cell division protease FtsH